MLYALIGIFTLSGVVLGYRLGTQRVINRYFTEDNSDLPPPQSPTQLAKRWRAQHVTQGGKVRDKP